MPSPILLHMKTRFSFSEGFIPSPGRLMTYLAKRPIRTNAAKGKTRVAPDRCHCQYSVKDANTAPKKLMISAPQAPTARLPLMTYVVERLQRLAAEFCRSCCHLPSRYRIKITVFSPDR